MMRHCLFPIFMQNKMQWSIFNLFLLVYLHIFFCDFSYLKQFSKTRKKSRQKILHIYRQIFSAHFIGKFSRQISSANFISKFYRKILSATFVCKLCQQILSANFMGNVSRQISSANFIGKFCRQIVSANFIDKFYRKILSANFIGKLYRQVLSANFKSTILGTTIFWPHRNLGYILGIILILKIGLKFDLFFRFLPNTSKVWKT